MDEYKINFKEYNRANIDRSREMRKNQTSAEKKVWENVLKLRPLWYKFLRQKPINSFILDFYCAKLLLAIELDGKYHKETEEYDLERDTNLHKKWIEVIRYRNEDVLWSPDKTYKKMMDAIYNREREIKKLPSSPPWQGRI